MKIGVLTFHNAHNYGAVLQAYALRTKLRAEGHSADIINYRNQKIENSYQKKILAQRKKIQLRHPRMALINLRLNIKKYLDVRCAQLCWEQRVHKFNKFIDEVLLENNISIVKKEELEKVDADAFICGSDQIWTDYLTGGLDMVYLLDFDTNARKIAYGASKSNAEFSKEQEMLFKDKLADFWAISAREKSLAQKLTDICGRYVDTVLDPTLLLTQKEYRQLEEPTEVSEDYVLAYFLVEDEMLVKCAEEASKQLNAKLVEIHYFKQRKRNHIQIADCSPGEFLFYMRNAKCILTNSFHGVVFSIIYHKKFYGVYEKDSRKDDLLDMLQLGDRHIRSVSEMNVSKEIDYSISDKILSEMQKKSTTFLKMAFTEL